MVEVKLLFFQLLIAKVKKFVGERGQTKTCSL